MNQVECSNCTMIYSFFIYRDPATICYLQFNKGPIVVSKKEVSIHWFLCQKLIATWLPLQKVELTLFPWFTGCWCQKSSSDGIERRKGLDLWKTIFTTPISEKRPSSSLQAKKREMNRCQLRRSKSSCYKSYVSTSLPEFGFIVYHGMVVHGSHFSGLTKFPGFPWASSIFFHFPSIFFNVLFF